MREQYGSLIFKNFHKLLTAVIYEVIERGILALVTPLDYGTQFSFRVLENTSCENSDANERQKINVLPSILAFLYLSLTMSIASCFSEINCVYSNLVLFSCVEHALNQGQ